MSQYATAQPVRPGAATRRPRRAIHLTLLGSFELRCSGTSVQLPMSAQHTAAFVALHERPLLRVYVAGMLWLNTPEERAFANLRSTLWRLHQPGYALVEATGRELRLAPEVRVDFREAVQLAHRLLSGSTERADLDVDWRPLAGELLPDWYDDWILLERERFRQLGLHALELLSERLAGARRFGPALEVALAAVAGEPLRESAHRVLIKTHLAEGNIAEAIRQYSAFKQLLRDRMALDPSPAMEALVEGLTIG